MIRPAKHQNKYINLIDAGVGKFLGCSKSNKINIQLNGNEFI